MEPCAKGGREIGYIRVSPITKDTERQLKRIRPFLNKIFEDKVSAGIKDRPGLAACMEHLQKGDCLHVQSMDRLARNLKELHYIVDTLTEKGVVINFHKEQMVFDNDDIFKLIPLLETMEACAGFEQALLKERHAEGIAKAQKAGKHCGRSRKLTQEQRKDIRTRAKAGEKPAALACEFDVSTQTIYRTINEGKD